MLKEEIYSQYRIVEYVLYILIWKILQNVPWYKINQAGVYKFMYIYKYIYICSTLKYIHMTGMVAYTCNLINWEAEARAFLVQWQLYSEFGTSLNHIEIIVSKQKKKKGRNYLKWRNLFEYLIFLYSLYLYKNYLSFQ